jgi:hypothetical protein
MRKLLMLFLIGATSVIANISVATTNNAPTYENAVSPQAKLAELQAILDAEDDDDLDDDLIDPNEGDDDLDDDLLDPDEGDIQDDEDDQENATRGDTTPT